MLPSTIPLFPLPTVVLFPNVFLPLHIFEPRYRQMVTEALAGERLIGMVLLQPGYEAEYEGSPATYDVGCAGLITHAERLEDGRFNIILQGLEKFRILGEESPDERVLYRRGLIQPIADPLSAADRPVLKEVRHRIEALLQPHFKGSATGRLPQAMADHDLINALAQYLDLEPIEKQALLETQGPLQRCRSLVELLEMKLLAEKGTRSQGVH
jgi:Lon protease-like protein